MRRVLLIISLTLTSLWLVALPALAAEEKAADAEDINGVLLALIVGVILGAVLFLDAYAGGPEDDAHDTHDAHGAA